ncbi:MAG TPA: segregation/condensation protein A [Anaerolineaceae bacterium]|nr:segregation/condensation protein A [Anaerolineaceae bacterium]
MNLEIAGHQTEGYRIDTEVYQGPLDLLLHLIEKAELDITRLALAQVTDQYLDYLNNIEDRDAAEVSAFLVIAAKLLQIKSEALLPRPPVRVPGEEDPGEALAQQLIAYKRFKKVAEWLLKRETSSLRTYLHLATPPKIEAKLDLTGITLSDLVLAAQSILMKDVDHPYLSDVVSIPIVTIRDRIRKIIDLVKTEKSLNFHRILGSDPSRVEVVVTFLALLELVKRHVLNAHQETLFSDIEFIPDQEWDGSFDLDLDLIV